jgi:uncharacterized protein (TIGR02271 family)
MHDPEYAEVVGKGGVRGYILGPSETQPDSVDVEFDDGQEIAVPASSLRRQPDGSFLLSEDVMIPVLSEELRVSKRTRETGTVRVGKEASERQETVSMPLMSERAHVRRVLIGKPVTEAPPVRREGDTIIFPVVEEVPVVTKQLILKEELHVSRQRSTQQHNETVTLRDEHAVVEHSGENAAPRGTAPIPATQARPRSILDPTKPRPSILGPNPNSRPARRNRIFGGGS